MNGRSRIVNSIAVRPEGFELHRSRALDLGGVVEAPVEGDLRAWEDRTGLVGVAGRSLSYWLALAQT